MGILGWLAAAFASDKVQDLAIDGIKKLGGLNDMTDAEKASHIREMVKLTQHQSPIRRFIAFLLTMLYACVIIVWLISAGLGYYLDLTPSLEFAGAVRMFMADVIVQPFNIILAFYFVTQISARFSSGK